MKFYLLFGLIESAKKLMLGNNRKHLKNDSVENTSAEVFDKNTFTSKTCRTCATLSGIEKKEFATFSANTFSEDGT